MLVGELWIRLNSFRDLSGTTTRNRWEQLRVLSNGRLGPAKVNRIARFLNSGGKFLGAQIIRKPTQGLDIQAWKDELRKKIPKGQQVFAFTDGSTDVKLDPKVSGAGICLVSNNEVVWEGGFRVQTNGNNYVARSAPDDSPLTIITLGRLPRKRALN